MSSHDESQHGRELFIEYLREHVSKDIKATADDCRAQIGDVANWFINGQQILVEVCQAGFNNLEELESAWISLSDKVQKNGAMAGFLALLPFPDTQPSDAIMVTVVNQFDSVQTEMIAFCEALRDGIVPRGPNGGAHRWSHFPFCLHSPCGSRVVMGGYCSRHTNECSCGCGDRCAKNQRYISGHGKGTCVRCGRQINISNGETHCPRCRRSLKYNPDAAFTDTRQKNREAPDGRKWCTRCRQYRLHKFFNSNKQAPDGLSYVCKPCQLDSGRIKRLQDRYGMAQAEYDAIKEFQGGRCYICQWATGASRALSVDHDHSKEVDGMVPRDAIRGLLCDFCNRLLGFAKDDPEFFGRAIEYLIDPPAQHFLHVAAGEPVEPTHG